MLQIAQDNIHSAQDRARNYDDKNQRDITFNEGDLVYSKVFTQLKTLKMGKCQKLSPRYCGPFKILKKIGDIAYRIKLSNGIRAHPIFYVNKLKRTLHPQENIVSPNVLLELIEPLATLHEPKKILGFRDKHTKAQCV